jgi:hypothetical protein
MLRQNRDIAVPERYTLRMDCYILFSQTSSYRVEKDTPFVYEQRCIMMMILHNTQGTYITHKKTATGRKVLTMQYSVVCKKCARRRRQGSISVITIE